MSGQLFCSNVMADCNLLASPANVNAGWPTAVGLEVELVVADNPEPAMADERNSIQGTAASFPALDPLEEVVSGVGGGVVAAEGLLWLPEDELRDMTAKSILPEAGLNITSLMVPTLWP